MPKRILLLGGSGLLGAPAARALHAAGHLVTVLTRGARSIPDGVETILADRKDPAALGSALQNRVFDLTVDLLAYDAGDVAQLLDLPGFSPGRYVLISTGQVYLVAAEPRPPFAESASAIPARPMPEADTRDWHNWTYGVGKRAAEGEVERRRELGNLDAVALRLPIVQGVGDASRRLWAYLQRLLDGGPLLVVGDSSIPVRFVWAEDVARLLVLLASGVKTASFAYNVSMPDEPPLAEFLRRAAASLGVPAQLVECTEAELVQAGLDASVSPFSGPWCSRPEPTRLREELGFVCRRCDEWLPEVVGMFRSESAPEPHEGYARRAAEIELAKRLLRVGA